MHTLVTFLGKGRDDPKTGYRKALSSFRTTAKQKVKDAHADPFHLRHQSAY